MTVYRHTYSHMHHTHTWTHTPTHLHATQTHIHTHTYTCMCSNHSYLGIRSSLCWDNKPCLSLQPGVRPLPQQQQQREPAVPCHLRSSQRANVTCSRWDVQTVATCMGGGEGNGGDACWFLAVVCKYLHDSKFYTPGIKYQLITHSSNLQFCAVPAFPLPSSPSGSQQSHSQQGTLSLADSLLWYIRVTRFYKNINNAHWSLTCTQQFNQLTAPCSGYLPLPPHPPLAPSSFTHNRGTTILLTNCCGT